MIKFFRKIRQKLLSENKFSKYLIYAIGEIILVVIGILIALTINNWNEKQKALVIDGNLVTAAVIELKSVKEELETNLKSNKRILDKMSEFLDNDFPESEKDSPGVLILLAHNPSELKIPLVGSILENNVSHSISDTELLKMIRELNSLNERIIITQSYLDQFWNSNSVEFLIGNEYRYNAIDEAFRQNNSKSENYRKLYSDSNYKGLISLKWILHNDWVSAQGETLNKLQDILNYLNNKHIE